MHDSEHPVEQLAWLANGTLGEAERAAVEAHLAGCEACRAEYRLLCQLREGLDRHWKEQEPGELGWARLRAAIRQEKARASTAGSAATPQRGRWLAVAAGLVLAVQAAVIGWLWQDRGETPVYQAASGEVAAGSIQVRFRPDATEGAIRELLDGLGLEIVGGPGALGIYRLSGTDDPAAVAAALRRSGLVEEVMLP